MVCSVLMTAAGDAVLSIHEFGGHGGEGKQHEGVSMAVASTAVEAGTAVEATAKQETPSH